MDNFRKKVGERINTALATKDIKQKDLARTIGVTDNTISYYVSGARTPNTEQIVKMAQYLGVSTDYLLGTSEVASNDPNIQMISKYTGLSDKSINALHYDLTENEQTKVFTTINSFIENDNTIYFFDTFEKYCRSENFVFLKDLNSIFEDNSSDFFDIDDNFVDSMVMVDRKNEWMSMSLKNKIIEQTLLSEINEKIKWHAEHYKRKLSDKKRGGPDNADDPETR